MSRGTLFAGATLVALMAPGAGAPSSVTILKAHLTGTYLHTTSTGSGTATVTFKGSTVCWKFTYSGLDRPGDSGIHMTPPPPPGKHKTAIFPFTATTSTKPGCDPVAKWSPAGPGWVKKILADPGRFYVIIGTTKYPQGAIGGVLKPG